MVNKKFVGIALPVCAVVCSSDAHCCGSLTLNQLKSEFVKQVDCEARLGKSIMVSNMKGQMHQLGLDKSEQSLNSENFLPQNLEASKKLGSDIAPAPVSPLMELVNFLSRFFIPRSVTVAPSFVVMHVSDFSFEGKPRADICCVYMQEKLFFEKRRQNYKPIIRVGKKQKG